MPATFPDRLTDGVRRVTTGISDDGRAVVVNDERVTGDERALLLWQADAPPVAGDPVMPAVRGWWPPPGGIRVTLSSRAPDRLSPASPRPSDLPDIDDTAGFHSSASADVVIVLSGRIWCELDDGVEVELAAGDVLVQNGTRHRWRNHSDAWPIIAVVIVGASSEASGRPLA